MSTLETFAPSWYYHEVLKSTEIVGINETFSKYINDESNFSQPPAWNCNVQTSYGCDNGTPQWTFFMDTIKPYLEDFLEKVQCNAVEVLPQEAWVNKYNPGDSQEAHDHCTPNTNLSMVYFHRLNADDNCDFKFFNRDHSYYRVQGLSDIIALPFEQTTTPAVRQGSIIFFPSHYPHLVSPHRGTQTRITFSANFYIVPKGWRG